MATESKRKLFMNMDKALHAELKRVAEIERRDVTAQIHIMLYEQLKQYENKQA